MRILAWYIINPNGIENKNIIKYPYPSSMRKRDIRATYFCFYAIVSRVTLSKGKLFFMHTFQIK